MRTVPSILRLRRSRRKQAASAPATRSIINLTGCSAVLSLFVALAGIGLALGYAIMAANLPSLELIPTLLEPPAGNLRHPTQLFDRSGEHLLLSLENPGAEDSEYMWLSEEKSPQLSASLVKATLVVLEPNFWDSPGYSLQGNLDDQPATIAERLVADLLLWNEDPGLVRSLRAKLLAGQITSRFGRAKVIEWYLNSANFGRLAFGPDAAARAYLGKPATRLSLAESALLVAALQAPALNPWDAPRAALERQQEVLKFMLAQGVINQEEYRQASQEKIRIQPVKEPPTLLAPAFTDLALGQLAQVVEPGRLARGGIRIQTTLDYDLQLQVNCAVANQLARLENPQAAEIPASDGSTCQAARLLPTISTNQALQRDQLAAGLVVLDPTSGQVLAISGNTDPGENPARFPGRPPGSLLTPFIYLTAFTRGASPSSLVWDIPASLPEGFPDFVNPDEKYHGPVRLRIALANDYLVPAAQTLAQMGVDQVWETARQLGLGSLQNAGAQAGEWLLGTTGELTLLELTQAYGVFANQGVLAGQISTNSSTQNNGLQPATTLWVGEIGEEPWLDCLESVSSCPARTRPVISTQLAYLLTHMLSDETARWPSLGHPNPLEIGRPAGAKIGRTAMGLDAWTIGYTPNLVVGVWLGMQEETSFSALPTAAAGLWHAVMQFASLGQPAQGWEIPPGISTMQVCDPSGMLPTASCPAVVLEIFLSGSEPTHPDTLFRAYQLNRETGRLATIFTPPELIEQQVFLLAPPQAQGWMIQAGLPRLPQEYDIITPLQGLASQGARIRAPGMFSSVSGKVPILGTAVGSEFAFYRLQFGQGLNPENWLQIGADGRSPVNNAQLAVWDTRGISGLYVLQLLVVSQDQQVESAVVQVTVDNQAPVVDIIYPLDGQHLVEDETVVLQADASDDLELAEVQFFVDGRLLQVLKIPPFVVPWNAEPGEHSLKVEAFDRARNKAESEVKFEVER